MQSATCAPANTVCEWQRRVYTLHVNNASDQCYRYNLLRKCEVR